jgi:hypothetical protein
MSLVIKRQVAGKEDRTECNTTLIFETVDRIASFFFCTARIRETEENRGTMMIGERHLSSRQNQEDSVIC